MIRFESIPESQGPSKSTVKSIRRNTRSFLKRYYPEQGVQRRRVGNNIGVVFDVICLAEFGPITLYRALAARTLSLSEVSQSDSNPAS